MADISKIKTPDGTSYDIKDTISRNGGGVQLTQAQYDALVSAGTVDANTTYFITDANNTTASYAAGVTYDNTSSGLSATNVQDGIDTLYANRAYAYRMTSNTSFTDACNGTILSDVYGAGKFLDNKVHSVRTTLSTTDINYITGTEGGAMMFATVFVFNSNYYSGQVYTYHKSNPAYGGYGFLNFQYMNGAFAINYISAKSL